MMSEYKTGEYRTGYMDADNIFENYCARKLKPTLMEKIVTFFTVDCKYYKYQCTTYSLCKKCEHNKNRNKNKKIKQENKYATKYKIANDREIISEDMFHPEFIKKNIFKCKVCGKTFIEDYKDQDFFDNGNCKCPNCGLKIIINEGDQCDE